MTALFGPANGMTGKSGDAHPAKSTYDETTRLAQNRFLALFPGIGNISEAAQLAGLSPATVYGWRRDDVLGFHARFLQAREEDADCVESIARKRILNPTEHGRLGSDVLVIATLNAKRPQEYRPNVTVTHDLGARVLATLAQLQAKDRANGLGWGAQAPEQLPPGTVEQASATEPVAPEQQEPPQDTSTS